MYDYENFHKKYSVDIHDDPARHIKIAELCNGIVCDIGCGTGTLSDYYEGEYFGFDISKNAIDKAKHIRRKSALFEVQDATKIKDMDFSNINTIVLSEFLEHIGDDKHIFDTILKTAKKGTRIVISVPNGHHFDCDEHVRYFTIPELRKKFEKMGEVRFYDWSGAKGQIIMTIDIDYKYRDKITLVMVVKNEEKGLENAILSCVDHVNEIIIAVDDSTTDKTREIAKQYADVLKTFNWENDFAKARNNAHKNAKGDWILFLDGHEILTNFSGIPKDIDEDVDGLMCTIRMENGIKFRNPRVYKNGVQFKGAVHEKQQCKKTAIFLGCEIQHDRIHSQDEYSAGLREQQRDKMMPEIMGKQWRKDHKNIRASFHMGLHYSGKKNRRLAKKWFKRYLRYSTIKGERWFVYFQMATMYFMKGHKLRAMMCLEMAELEIPGRWEVRKYKGIIYFSAKKWDQAIEQLNISFDEDRAIHDYKPWERDNANTFNMVGECFFNLGIYDKAHLSFLGASRSAKTKEQREFLIQRAKLMKDIMKK